jgi:uncharacterized membrane protein YqiK
MPNSEDVQSPPPDPIQAAELLDQSSLNTVLDIVEAIETAEELTLLETLTPAQKRQVWSTISDEQKQRLREIRTREHATSDRAIAEQELDQKKPNTQLEVSSLTLEAEDLEAEDLPLDLQEDLEELTPTELAHLMVEQSGTAEQPSIEVGDRVVLLPKPQISSAELIAIWDVVDIQDNTAQIETKRLGTRHYPLSWMVIYPELDF